MKLCKSGDTYEAKLNPDAQLMFAGNGMRIHPTFIGPGILGSGSCSCPVNGLTQVGVGRPQTATRPRRS